MDNTIQKLTVILESLDKNISKLNKFLNNNFMETKKKEITVKDFADEYLEFVKENLSFKYVISIRTSTKYLLSYFGENNLLIHFTFKDAENLIAECRKTAPKGYYNYYKNFNAMFGKAVRWNYIDENPFEKLNITKPQRNKSIILTLKEIEKLKPYLKPILFDMVLLAFSTGLRLNEDCNLKLSDLNLDENYLTIGSKTFRTKSGKIRQVPLNQTARKVIMRNLPKVFSLHEDQFLFSKKDGSSYSSDYVSKSFKKACRKAGLDEGIHFHSLRISFGSNLVRKGASLYQVQRILGHSSPNTTQQHYAFLNLDSLREAVSKLDNYEMLTKINEN